MPKPLDFVCPSPDVKTTAAITGDPDHDAAVCSLLLKGDSQAEVLDTLEEALDEETGELLKRGPNRLRRQLAELKKKWK